MESHLFSEEELHEMGIKKIGKNVQVNRTCVLYNNEKKIIGNNVRIDNFCVLGGDIEIGSNVHIGSHSGLFGRYGIKFENFSGISSNVMIYSRTDDYDGGCLTNPTVGDEFINFRSGQVLLKKHVVVGSSSIILPDLTIGEGSAVGALSLVNKSLEPWGIYIGIPVKRIKDRKKDVLELEKKYFEKINKKIILEG